MTENEQLQIGKLIGQVSDLQHRFDRMENHLHGWMKQHEREAGERDRSISQLQAFRAQVVVLATLLGGAVSLIGEHLLSH